MLLSRERADCATHASVLEPHSVIGGAYLRKTLLFERGFHVLQFNRGHHGPYAQRQDFLVEIVESPGNRLASTCASLKPLLRRSTRS
jgi:hypothetical protein